MLNLNIVQAREKQKHNLGTNMQISAGCPTRLTHVLYDLSLNHKYESLDGLARLFMCLPASNFLPKT